MKKIAALAVLFGTLTACGSTTLSVPDKIEYSGQEAFDVVTLYTSNFDYPPTDAQTEIALKELATGKKFSRLPARAAKACPSGGYRILKKEEAKVGSYLISAIPKLVSRWTQRFIIACE
ncbi:MULTISPECIES: hypothetical protein [unclassified Roseovarius]|uniref:hypothetical protein n=1 Tax=unclassified Roseovarius TaxID=2614913 RepID=UPI00273DC751|nr:MULTISPECIES: hypothetical protein [unclassified Roseovarius]